MNRNDNALCGALSALLILCAVFAIPARAVALSLDPVSQLVAPGGAVAVDLNISGLENFAAPSLGEFLVDITFDNSILTFDSVAYGPFLGDPSNANKTGIVTTLGAGSVSLDEFSFLFDFELDAIQAADFTLVTLQFTGVNIGTTILGFGALDLSNAVRFTIIPSLESASISVVPIQSC